MKSSAANASTIDVYDITESRGFLDTQEFFEYCVLVRDVIRAAPKGLWLAEIHRALGDKANPRWTFDALANLQAVGDVCESFTLPIRYMPREPSPPPKKYWNTDKR